VGWGTAAGLVVVALAGAVALGLPGDGTTLAIGLAVAAGPLGALAVFLVHRPEFAAWCTVLLFATSGELKLRVSSSIGVLKDGYVVLLVGLVVLLLARRPGTLRRLRPLSLPLAALVVLVGMYLADPAGAHDTHWLFGTRLLLEVLVLLGVGMLLAPGVTLVHLVGAMAVVVPFEAIFAWVQQAAGAQRLVYQWGYQFGAQVRSTSGGGLRVSGTFEDPFQLAALAVLGIALALFVVRGRRVAWLLGVSGAAVLGATQVRTAFIQVGLLLVIWAVRRGWGRSAAVLGLVAALLGVMLLATSRSSVSPGAPAEPLIFSLNGRSTSWALAVDGWQSFVTGNGVGARGVGSTRTSTAITAAPAYDGSAPPAYFAGNPAFLDSSYAQVQSDVGFVGAVALILAIGSLALTLARRCRDRPDGAAWGAFAVLTVSAIDWIGRASLGSYTTGFLTLYILGVLIGTSLQREDRLPVTAGRPLSVQDNSLRLPAGAGTRRGSA
jgi:hypothetical protein